jgi:hypothetical protein
MLKIQPKMASRCRKCHHKVDKLRGLLNPQEKADFDNFVLWNPTYASIQGWFAQRGHKISINAIAHWWKANFPDSGESKILKGISMELGRDFDKPPYNSVLRLAVTAAQVLSDYSTGKLSKAEPHSLMEIQLELFSGLRSLSMLSHLSKF